MTDKQKQAIKVLNHIREVEEAMDDEEYFLLLDFVVGIPQPIINMPFQRIETTPSDDLWWHKDGELFKHRSTPFDPRRNYEPDGKFGSPTATTELTMQGKSASSITEKMKAKENEMSYGDRLIKEGRSPI